MEEREALERLAEEVYRAYLALPGIPEGRVEPERLARELLGLRIVRRRLSPGGTLLGLTAASPVGVPVWNDAGQLCHYYLDGRTVLLDPALFSPWASPGRCRFTLMHEVSHLLLARRRPETGPARSCLCRAEERRADTLAAALLMPRPLLARRLPEFGFPAPRQYLDPRLDPESWGRFGALAEALGVSRQALGIRLKQLGLSVREPGRRSPPDVLMDEEDYAVLEGNACRNTTQKSRTRPDTPGPWRSRAG